MRRVLHGAAYAASVVVSAIFVVVATPILVLLRRTSPLVPDAVAPGDPGLDVDDYECGRAVLWPCDYAGTCALPDGHAGRCGGVAEPWDGPIEGGPF